MAIFTDHTNLTENQGDLILGSPLRPSPLLSCTPLMSPADACDQSSSPSSTAGPALPAQTVQAQPALSTHCRWHFDLSHTGKKNTLKQSPKPVEFCCCAMAGFPHGLTTCQMCKEVIESSSLEVFRIYVHVALGDLF